jgi:tetratricopeptide (TPR) repeat protein
MKKNFFFALLIAALHLQAAPGARAQDGPVWQVRRFDVTANVPAATTRSLAARAIITARNVGRGAGRSFTVRINPAAEVRSVTVGGAAAQFTSRPEARTKLNAVATTLPAPVAPGSELSVAFDYALPVESNTGLAAISAEGSQFLPLSNWYPTPNSPVSPRGSDAAPLRLTVNAPTGESVVSTGAAAGATAFEQTLNVQPFFLTGRWDVVEGAGDARGTSAHLLRGATAEERARAESLIAVAAAARTFYTGLLGPATDAPVRLVAVRRGAGFDGGGALLLDAAVFRRPKTDAVTALSIAEAVARLWVGGVTPVYGDGAGALREGLTRHLALRFFEKHFGAEAAVAERLRERIAYAAISRRDAPLSVTNPLDPTYFTSTANKGAMIWRLAERVLGADEFAALLRAQLQGARETGLTLAALRAALNERGGASLKLLLDAGLDQPTELDLLVGLPRPRGAEQLVALRNTGALPLVVTVAATTERGERVTAEAALQPQDFGDAVLKTAAKIVRVEVDPDKLYPQINYSNDLMPAAPALEESLADATRTLAAQEYARSESIAREMLVRTPLMQEARVLLARSLLEQGKLDEAEREFRAAQDAPLPLPDTLAWAAVGMGQIALRRGQPGDASRRFSEAIQMGASYAPTLAARAARLRADAAQGATTPTIDEAVRAAVAQLDAAIKGGRKAEIDALIAPGELSAFSRGIVGSQPELWQSRVLRTESLGGDRVAADVQIGAKVLGQERNSTAVLVFSRAGGRMQLVEIPIFEERVQ